MPEEARGSPRGVPRGGQQMARMSRPGPWLRTVPALRVVGKSAGMAGGEGGHRPTVIVARSKASVRAALDLAQVVDRACRAGRR